MISLPGLIILYLVIPRIQMFTKFLYNLSDDWLENMVLFHSYLFSTHHYLYMSSVIFGNMAINSFCTAILLETFPALSGSYILLVSIHPIVQEILQFCSFTSFICVYFMLFFVGEYGLVMLMFFCSSVFQFTGELWGGMQLANQSAVFFEWTDQRAGYSPCDFFGREGIFGSWDRVWVESRAANLAMRLSGNDVTAEMTSMARFTLLSLTSNESYIRIMSC